MWKDRRSKQTVALYLLRVISSRFLESRRSEKLPRSRLRFKFKTPLQRLQNCFANNRCKPVSSSIVLPGSLVFHAPTLHDQSTVTIGETLQIR